MHKLYLYDVTPDTQTQLQAGLAGVDGATVIADHLTLDSCHTDATIISVFVGSRVTAEMLELMPNLKLIACRSTGVDNVDLVAAKARGIAVASVPTYGDHTVAEYTFGLLLALTRKIPQAEAALARGETDHLALEGTDLAGKMFGLVGSGKIGRNVAAIAKAFGMTVLAYDPFPNEPAAAQIGFTYASLSEVLTAADVISLHVPHTNETHHLLNADRLKLVKPSVLVVNTARGEIIDTKALVAALEDHRIAGAALDVFEGEKLAGVEEELHQLRAATVDQMVLEQHMELSILERLPNVVMTNHNAYNTLEAVSRINQTTIENIISFIHGQPVNIV